SATLPRPPTPYLCYFMASSGVTVAAGKLLTLAAGAVIKMDIGARLTVSGTLLANGQIRSSPYSPIVITSIRDDHWLGDTNGDGSATVASIGDWDRIEFTTLTNPSQIKGIIFRYGGRSSLGQVYVHSTGTQPTPNVLVRDCLFHVE